MASIVLTLASFLIFTVTGVALFFLLLNRWLLLIPDGYVKIPLILLMALLLVGGGCVAGITLPNSPWLALPVFISTLLIIGEIRELSLRRRHTGSPPVDTRPHGVAITAPITTTDLMIHRYEVTAAKVRKPLRIVHITDLHADQRFPWDYYLNAFATAEALKPDFAVFTGDYISHIKALPCMKEIFRPIAKHGNFAVLGNHDYWVDPDGIAQCLRECGIHVLTNETYTFALEGTPIAVTGYDYPWGTREETIAKQPQETLHLVLSHTPDNIYRVAAQQADLAFSGHCHAGQVRLPLRGSMVVPSIYGCRFDHGHFVIAQTHLFVASGLGASNPPVRIYCQPDIFVVDIVPKK